MGRYTNSPVTTRTTPSIMEELFSSLPMYEEKTHGIRIQIQIFWIPQYLEQEEETYSWIYRVCIHNENDYDVILKERYWESTDSEGYTEKTSSLGDQVVIDQGDYYECACFATLATPSGFMRGYCVLQRDGYSQSFEAPIPPFSLDSPFEDKQIH